MLKFEGIKEFDIEKLDKKPDLTNRKIELRNRRFRELSRNFQIIFSDDVLGEDDCEMVEKAFNEHEFSIKNEIVKTEVIYNIDLDTATIAMTIHCPLMYIDQISEEKFNELLDKQKSNFEEYYEKIKPY
jgi:hypothetical protein